MMPLCLASGGHLSLGPQMAFLSDTQASLSSYKDTDHVGLGTQPGDLV